MNKLKLTNYNLQHTLLGGQAFNWDLIDGAYYGFMQDKVIKFIQKGDELFWQTYPEKDNFDFINNYLGLDLDYENILEKISIDPHIKKAIQAVPHVRLLKQDFEQTFLSFILTSHKNIKAVRKSVRDLSSKFGDKIIVDNITFNLFPKAKALSKATEKELRDCGVGFRANYLLEAAKKISDPEFVILSGAEGSDFTDENLARVELLKFKGVGDKIADCVLIFSLGFYTVTPIDIWGKRVLTDLYGVDPKLNYSKMREWYKNYFGEHTAFAGQFLFEYIRQESGIRRRTSG